MSQNKGDTLSSKGENALIQSGELTLSGADFTKTQKRLLYEIIKNVQYIYEGANVKVQKKIPVDLAELFCQKFAIPIKTVIGDGDRNYQRLKESLLEMTHKLIRVQDDGKHFSVVSFFDSIDIPEGSGTIYVRMTLSFYERMADITRGLTVYDYEVARNFPSIYSMKMYEFIARWDNRPPRVVPLEYLRNILGVNISEKDKDGKTVIRRKYPNINNFEEYTLKVAKEQINDPKYGSAYTFDYKRNVEGGKVSGYTIYVKKNGDLLPDGEKRFESSKKHDSIHLEVPKEIVDKLTFMGWKREEIYPHIVLLKTCAKYIPNFYNVLSRLCGNSREEHIENPVGWVVAAIRKMLLERGIEMRPDGEVVRTNQANGEGDIISQAIYRMGGTLFGVED